MARTKKKAPKRRTKTIKKAPKKKVPRKKAPRKKPRGAPPPATLKTPRYKRRTVVVSAKTPAALQKEIEKAEIACLWQGVHVACCYTPKSKAPWFTLTYMERS